MIFISSPITPIHQGKDGPGSMAFSHLIHHPAPPPNDTFISHSHHVRLGVSSDRRTKCNNAGAIRTNADIGISEREPREDTGDPGKCRANVSRGNEQRIKDVLGIGHLSLKFARFHLLDMFSIPFRILNGIEGVL